ncbi:class I SAM-dependent methyltransferase [Methylocapsa palsarum]|uniref:SAM-dependent methyltransferase, MidA family n=1 Tax=Methylocapsa palsarum TaxID=1612308 RepID=A0A1I3Z2I5_9HYPH|nr:SAM-dependent methyltransferase [Methylocapsa palsarum]SFK38207.1 SAM-dependent methyltransferase, MidA family [Methylocapsa palsarum]
MNGQTLMTGESPANPLESLICEIIAENGPISLERYMTLALAHPAHGYYRSQAPFGAAGDFITAPEISQMFGELIGVWCVEVWRAMGAPVPFRLVELGPGRGVLMADLLRAAKVSSAFRAALDRDLIEVDLVETSEILRETQRRTLQGCGAPLAWRARADDVPEGAAIFIANEFFDCLPVRHFVRGADGWRERLVGLDHGGKLCFGLAPEPEQGFDPAGETGDVIEICSPAVRLMESLAARISGRGGALLAFDYGYDYGDARRGETLQALRRHNFADPLRDPGKSDLTAHVDFGGLARAARESGAFAFGPLAQGEWLMRMGIAERAGALRSRAKPEQAASIDSALERLTGAGLRSVGETHMAKLFKVLAVTPAGFAPPPGFEGLRQGMKNEDEALI